LQSWEGLSGFYAAYSSCDVFTPNNLSLNVSAGIGFGIPTILISVLDQKTVHNKQRDQLKKTHPRVGFRYLSFLPVVNREKK
jgi:hypothetical protein